MCLLVIAYELRADVPCILVANRDERYDRPTAPLQLWEGPERIVAGRDLEQGGTWLGVSARGRFAALTNFRSGPPVPAPESRGRVVTDFLGGTAPPAAYVAELAEHGERYGGFSLLAGELGGELYYVSNRGGEPRRLDPGLYGLSNRWLDDPWPKVRSAKQRIAELLRADTLSPEALCDALLDRTVPPDDELPDTGIGLAAERRVAPSFIAGEHYGTRSTTAALLRREGQSVLYERTYGPGGVYLGDARVTFGVTP